MQDANARTPILVFLSPGVDVAASVENLGKKFGFSAEKSNYVSVSLGQVRCDVRVNPMGKQFLLHGFDMNIHKKMLQRTYRTCG